MASIDDLIAQGAGRRDFSPLGELFGTWRDGARARRENELMRARRSLGNVVGADGRPDYGAASLHLLRGGDIAGATAMARLGWLSGGRTGTRASAHSRGAGADTAAFDDGTGAYPDAPAVPADAPPAAPPSLAAPPPVGLPRLGTREEVEDALAQARAARAEGRDPNLILRRLHRLGIGVSGY